MNPVSTNDVNSTSKQVIFDKLTKHYELLNPDEIYDFIKLDIDLLNELDQVLPLLRGL